MRLSLLLPLCTGKLPTYRFNGDNCLTLKELGTSSKKTAFLVSNVSFFFFFMFLFEAEQSGWSDQKSGSSWYVSSESWLWSGDV